MLTQHTKSSMAVSAALGLGAGLLANFARKAAVQAPTALAGDWVEALAQEHRMALKIFDALERTSDGESGKRTALLAQLKHAIGRHAFQEENVIYPALRDHGLTPSEAELSKEHADVKYALFQLTQLDRADPQWLPLLRTLRQELQAHMEEEEATVFPQLRAKLSDQQNLDLAKAMNKEGFKLA